MSMPTATPARHILTPTALNRLVRDLLGDALPSVWIEGELSNVARPASGHYYFTLKDSAAQVRCAMFRGHAMGLRFRPQDGMQVLLRARVGLYEPRGEFQLVVESMEPAGTGALQRAFEELKARLGAEGLFADAHKRPLPRFPHRIGVITSASGAAVHDVLSVLSRRWPLVEVDVLGVPVQGREAPPAIVDMLRKASACGRYDVILLTRGGGSLEDLWAFNDEAVARAIHASAVPVVSAVGHEVDFSISDFVADLRAPTPSAAAELLVPDRAAIGRRLDERLQRLTTLTQTRLQGAMQRVDLAFARLHNQRPQARLDRARERLAYLSRRLADVGRASVARGQGRLDQLHAQLLARHPQATLALLRQRLAADRERLQRALVQGRERAAARVQNVGRALHAVSPLATLDRGYAILFTTDGRVLRSVAAAPAETPLRARLADGELALHVDTTPPA